MKRKSHTYQPGADAQALAHNLTAHGLKPWTPLAPYANVAAVAIRRDR